MRRDLGKNIDKKILNAVLQEAMRYGIGDVSTKEISVSLGISESVIFSHFGDKKNLMNSAMVFAMDYFSHPENLPMEIFKKPVDDSSRHEIFLKFQPLIKKKKELSYISQYVSSGFYDHKVVADVLSEDREAAKKIIFSIAEIDPSLKLDYIIDLFLGDCFIITANIANKVYKNNEENIARLCNFLVGGIKAAVIFAK